LVGRVLEYLSWRITFYTPNRGRVAERNTIYIKVGRGTRSIPATGIKTRPKPKRAVGVAPGFVISNMIYEGYLKFCNSNISSANKR